MNANIFCSLAVDHTINFSNVTNDTGLVDDLTVVLTTTVSVNCTETIIKAATENITTVSITTTSTERVTVYHTVVATPSPSPSSSSDTASSASCSSNDTNNTPIYVAIVIVIVGVLITIIIVIVGVFLCHRNQQGRLLDKSTNAQYKTTTDDATVVLEVENDLYGKDRLQPQLQ